MLVEARETCVYGCITCSRKCDLFEEEEEDMKSLISSSSIFSQIAKY
jgi:hypothetical protein